MKRLGVKLNTIDSMSGDEAAIPLNAPYQDHIWRSRHHGTTLFNSFMQKEGDITSVHHH